MRSVVLLAGLLLPICASAGVTPATSYDGKYTVSWTDPTGAGTKLVLGQSLNGGAWTNATVTGTFSKAFAGMAVGTYAYRIQVYEYDAGSGMILSYQASLGSVLVTTLTAPTAPGALTGPASSTNGSFTIGWGAATPAVTSYQLLENGAQVYSGTALSVALTGRKDGTFTYTARACNGAGCGPYTPSLVVTVDSTLTTIVPNAPAALPVVPAQGTVGALPGKPSTDGGAAGYQIEIEVPPGRGGMQPHVALSYGSKSGNGVAGVGWSLSSGGSIYRCPRTLELEGANRPVQLDSKDRLCFNGQRLVLASGSFGAAGSTYLSEIDPFDRITLDGDMSSSSSTFTVEHKSGTISKYAALVDAGITPATWHLVTEIDRQSNCVSYGYALYSSPGGGADKERPLGRIDWTGTMAVGGCLFDASRRSLILGYTTDREDKRTTYAAGQATVMTARLSTLTTSVGGVPVLKYVLGYKTSNATRRSLLTSVTKCAGAGCELGQLPPTTFEYQEDAPLSGAGSRAQLNDPTDLTKKAGAPWHVVLGSDFDGDGTRDTFYWNWNLGLQTYAVLSGSDGLGVLDSLGYGRDSGDLSRKLIPQDIDANNDGLPDVMGNVGGNLAFGNYVGGAMGAPVFATDTAGQRIPVPAGAILGKGDANGDGLIDLWITTSYVDAQQFQHTVSTGYLQVAPGTCSATCVPRFDMLHPVADKVPDPFQRAGLGADFNGDGAGDLYLEFDGTNGQNATNGISYFNADTKTYSPTFSIDSLVTGAATFSGPRFWMDVNGDGLQDRLFEGSVWVNRGGPIGSPHFQSFPISAVVDSDLTTPVTFAFSQSFVMDADGDGADELLAPGDRAGPQWCGTYANADSPMNPICYAEENLGPAPGDRSFFKWDAFKIRERGDGTYWLVRVRTGLVAPNAIAKEPGDYDGDGMTDVAFHLDMDTNTHSSGVPLIFGKYTTLGEESMGPYVARNRGRAPDLLIRAQDGLGKAATWVYQPLSFKKPSAAPALPPGPKCDPAKPFYVAHNAEANRPAGYVFFTSSMWAVSEFDVSHGTLGASTSMAPTCYRYEDAMLHLLGRGFQGFKKIIAEERLAPATGEDPPATGTLSLNNKTTTTSFHQEFPFTNRVKDVTVALASGDLLSRTTTWWHAQRTGATDVLGPWVLYPTATQEQRYDLPGGAGLLSTTTSVTEVDSLSGEARKSCQRTDDPVTATKLGIWPSRPTSILDAEVNASLYSQETRILWNDTVGWWLGRVDGSTKLVDFASTAMPDLAPRSLLDDSKNLIGPLPVKSTTPNAPAPLQCPAVMDSAFKKSHTTSTTWNGDTAALGRRRKPASESLSVTTGATTTVEATTSFASYDTFGNLTSRSVTARDVTGATGTPLTLTTSYTASADGYFIEKETNPAGHVATTVTSQAWGQPISRQQVQDGPFATTVLDRLGHVDTTTADGSQPISQRLLGPADASWEGGCGQAAAQRWTIQEGAPTHIECLDVLGRSIATIADAFDGVGAPGGRTITALEFNERGIKVKELATKLIGESTNFSTTYSSIDALGRPRAKAVLRDTALFAAGGGEPTLRTTYSYFGRTTGISVAGAPGGVGPLTMSRTLDGRGKLIETTQDVTSAGASASHPIQTRYLYDPSGAVTHIVDAAGNDLSASYDSLGRKTQVKDPDRGTWTYTWDGLGRLHYQRDARNNLTTQEYDLAGRPIHRSVTSGANSAVVEHAFWEWDTLAQKGVLVSQYDTTGYKRDLKYDALLRPYQVTTTIPAQELPVLAGNRTFVVRLGYDQRLGRLKAKGFPGVLNPAGETVLLNYTVKGFPLGETEFRADGQPGKQYRRVKSMSPQGQVTEQRLGNCLDELSQFDASTGQLLYQNAQRPVGATSLPADLLTGCPVATQSLRSADYAYDQFLNLKRHIKNLPLATPALQATEVYAYDELQRLRSSSRTWAGAGVAIPPEAENYTFDDLGNILTKTNYGTPYTYGTAARAAGNAGPHAVRAVKKLDTSTATFTYDLNGNLVDGDGRHVDFDLMDRPIRVCSSATGNCLQAAVQTDFLYGPDGSRYLQKLVTPGDTRYGSKTVYYVDKDYELVVWAPTAAMPAGSLEERSYLGSSVVVYRRDAAPKEIRYQTFDRLGSVEAVTKDDAAASLLSQDVHGFDAFGKPRTGLWTSSGDQLHPGGDLGATTDRGFTGHEHLDANFLIHMNGRVYDYRLGRFLSVDPIISNPASSQSINPYSYIGNNPLSGTDPTGYIAQYTSGGSPLDVIDYSGRGLKENRSSKQSGATGLSAQGANVALCEVNSPNQVGNTNRKANDDGDLNGVLLAANTPRGGRRGSGRPIAIEPELDRINAARVDSANARIETNTGQRRAELRPAGVPLTEADALRAEAFATATSPSSPPVVNPRTGQPVGAAGIRLPEAAMVCRGGACTAERFVQGSGVTLDANGKLQGVSVNSSPGATLPQLTSTIPNRQVGVTTVEQVRAAGGTVTPSPTSSNPLHCTMCGVTPAQAQELFTPTVRNPNVP